MARDRPPLDAAPEAGAVTQRLLRRELAVRKRLALDQRQDRVAKEEGVAAVVPAERGFVQVRGQVLDAELVVRADYGAVEEAPDAFHGVRVNLTVDPFPLAVIDTP